MAACTFFGHHDCPSSIKEKLYETIIDLIENHDVSMFYVGNHGSFDAIVRSVLRDLQSKCPQIQYAVVLAYLPVRNRSLVTMTIVTRCCQRESKPCRAVLRSHGETSGCSGKQSML